MIFIFDQRHMQQAIKSKISAAKLQIGAERKPKFFCTQSFRTLNAFVSAMKRSFFAYQ